MVDPQTCPSSRAHLAAVLGGSAYTSGASKRVTAHARPPGSVGTRALACTGHRRPGLRAIPYSRAVARDVATLVSRAGPMVDSPRRACRRQQWSFAFPAPPGFNGPQTLLSTRRTVRHRLCVRSPPPRVTVHPRVTSQARRCVRPIGRLSGDQCHPLLFHDPRQLFGAIRGDETITMPGMAPSGSGDRSSYGPSVTPGGGQGGHDVRGPNRGQGGAGSSTATVPVTIRPTSTRRVRRNA